MNNPTPRDSAQLPPLPSDAALDERIKTLMQQCGHPESIVTRIEFAYHLD